METTLITSKQRYDYNRLVHHPLQSFEWGEFRQETGVKVIREGFKKNEKLSAAFQLTIHKIPKTNVTIGYLPKGFLPTKALLTELQRIGKENNCIFIQLEPNVKRTDDIPEVFNDKLLRPSAHPLFTKFTFQLDLTISEEDLLARMHQKTRYNIRVAKKHNVIVQEETSDEAFNEFLKLNRETNLRQGFYSRPDSEFRKMKDIIGLGKKDTAGLSMHLFTSQYEGKRLNAWILFIFNDTLYYPYGASSSEHRNVMASNLVMWEAIKFGKEKGLKLFDMWGALGPHPDPKDSWIGFHTFKQGYGAELVEFVGSFDLIINPWLYKVYMLADKVRWLYLRARR